MTSGLKITKNYQQKKITHKTGVNEAKKYSNINYFKVFHPDAIRHPFETPKVAKVPTF